MRSLPFSPWPGTGNRQGGKWCRVPSFPEATKGVIYLINPPHSMIHLIHYTAVCAQTFHNILKRGCTGGNGSSVTVGILELLWCPCTALTRTLPAEPFSWALLIVSEQFSLLLSLFSFTPNLYLPLCINVTLFWSRQLSLTSAVPQCHCLCYPTNDCFHRPIVSVFLPKLNKSTFVLLGEPLQRVWGMSHWMLVLSARL